MSNSESVLDDADHPHRSPSVGRPRHTALSLDVASALARCATAQEALVLAVESITKNLDAAFARVWTYDETEQVLLLQASAGMYTHIDGPHARVPLGAFKIGRIALRRAPHLSNDVPNDPEVSNREWAKKEGLVAFAGYPLVVEGRLVGVMALFSRHVLEHDTLEALSAIADLVGVGIERKRTEEQLRRSEARYRLVSEAANEGIWFWDLATDFVEWNDRLLAMVGKARANVGPKFDDWLAFVHDDDRARVRSALDEHVAHHTPFAVELRLLSGDGSYRVCKTHGMAETNAHGKPQRMACAVTDIHDRKMAESALRASEHRYMQILDSVQDVVFCKTVDGVTYANHPARAYAGELAKTLVDEKRVFAGEIVEHTREPLRTATGETRLFYTVMSPLRDAAGAVQELVGVARDVTELRRIETTERFLAAASAALASSIEYEKTLQNVARIAVPEVADWCTVDMLVDGAIRRLAVSHVDPSKVALAREMERRWPPKLEDPGAGEVLRTGRSQLVPLLTDEMLEAISSDGEVRALVRELGLRSWMIVPLTIHGKTLGVITFVNAESGRSYSANDLAVAEELARRAAIAVENAQLYDETRRAVVARDKALREVKQANERLEERVADRTRELTDANRELEAFSYTVSHDLRAPIRHISGFVDLLGAHSGDQLDAKAQRYVQTIRASAQQMGSLIDALLAFSRMGRAELSKTRVDLDALVKETIRQYEPDLAGRKITWRVGALPTVMGDLATLRIVFANLIGNAVKYTRARDEATIEIAASVGDDRREVTIQVKDDGVGFNMSYVEKLFGVFQRLHAASSYEGTGIGLATVKRIIGRHGGRVWAEGAEGAGATFYLTLPLQEAERASTT